jgi:hypothetical protein
MKFKLHLPWASRSLAVAATVAFAAIASPAALAAPSHDSSLRPLSPRTAAASQTLTIPAGITRFTSAADGTRFSVTRSPAQAAQTITCTVNPSTPFRYYGGTYGGGEEGIASVNCTGTVYEIQVAVALFLNGSQITYNSQTAYSTNFATADTVYPLSAGNYKTGADGYDTLTYGGSATFIPLEYSSTVNLA